MHRRSYHALQMANGGRPQFPQQQIN